MPVSPLAAAKNMIATLSSQKYLWTHLKHYIIYVLYYLNTSTNLGTKQMHTCYLAIYTNIQQRS